MKIGMIEFNRKGPYETKEYFGMIAESIGETLFLSPLLERMQLGETIIYIARYRTGEILRVWVLTD